MTEALKLNGFCELSVDESVDIDGGAIGFLAAVAGAAAIVGLAKISIEVGKEIGKAIYYVTH